MLAFRQLGFYNCRYLECWLRSCQLLDSYNQRWTEEKGKGYLGLSFRSRLPQKNLNFDTDVVAWPPSSFYSLWVSSEQSLIPFDTSKKKKQRKIQPSDDNWGVLHFEFTYKLWVKLLYRARPQRRALKTGPQDILRLNDTIFLLKQNKTKLRGTE